MNPILLLGVAVISFLLESCSKNKSQEETEKDVLGEELIGSVQQIKSGMENSNKTQHSQISFRCDPTNAGLALQNCESRKQVFQGYIYRNFAKRFEINCYSKDIEYRFGITQKGTPDFASNPGMICDVGTQLPVAASSAHPAVSGQAAPSAQAPQK